MGKYRDQELIERVVFKVRSLPDDEQIRVRKELGEGYEVAKDDYNHIDEYTAPEEVERRRQAVYYYEDIFDELNKEIFYFYKEWKEKKNGKSNNQEVC